MRWNAVGTPDQLGKLSWEKGDEEAEGHRHLKDQGDNGAPASR